jgi:hypothetical protein
MIPAAARKEPPVVRSIRPISRLPLLAFALLATWVYITALTMERMRPALRHPGLVSSGLLVDLLLVVPLAFYLLAVRRAGWPARTLIPIVLFSLTGAALVLPDQREMLKRVSEAVSLPAELGLVTWITLRTVRSFRKASPGADDVLERLKMVAQEILPLRRAAEAVAFEIAILYYALFTWRRRPHVPAGTRAFTYHRKSGYGALLFALLIATLGEAIPVHLLVARWSTKAAWTLTALAAYGIFWFLADYRAARLRPILLDEDTLCLRTGLRWSLRIPRHLILAVHKKAPKAEPFLRTTLPTAQPLWIELSEPVTAQGPYGMEKTARWISFAVDEAAEFRQAVGHPLPS